MPASRLLTGLIPAFRRMGRPTGSSLSRSFAVTSGSKAQTIFSGIQPTGVPHLGNYLGALANWVALQKNADPQDRLIYSIVGYHAITLPQDPRRLERERMDIMASLLAIGINPERSILFHQDQVLEHVELAWILNCMTSMGKLKRVTTWKSKLAVARNDGTDKNQDDGHLSLGLFAYPVLQAADILLYKATRVPVGEDQRQHLELCRDLADVFNRTVKSPIFPVPRHIITPAKRVLSLRDPMQKMSKSAPAANSRILITDSFDEIAAKVRSAVTDSTRGITYDPISRPGVSNLVTIISGCTDESIESVVERLADKGHGELKGEVVDAVESKLGPVRREYERIKQDEGWIREVGRRGAEKARALAVETMVDVKTRLGLGAL
ncbi:hypothetical protein BOTBODRAFT_29062 [Botryobasidium botryosum FD-172 SS1]|uniref:Tryptophan--tRNA ligase, mitochondrial n=1 Tax=Botryobasidium botryosum (strain FD-172 SS1) TaxID=930990 RepID=A0A067MVF3_BOTB1|nr:hypothetical protein BOTBODRAFT_29062 [Botryobasidium botryosum FD-172 SS1]